MANTFELHAELRDTKGKGASRRLRRDNKIPAIMYGAEKAPVALMLNQFHVNKALENEAFYSHILTLHVNGEKQQAVLKDLQRHPYKPQILHMDFLRINPKEKIIMQIPLHFTGAETAPGVKAGGVVMHLFSTVEIRCLPANLPEFIPVDISQLELDDTIHLSQLSLPKGVELMAFAHGGTHEEHDAGVVKIHIPRVVVEEEAPVVAATAEATPAAATAATPAPAADKPEKKDKK